MGPKNQQLVDQSSSFYGTSPGSSFIYRESRYMDGGDGRDMSPKRERIVDQGSSFYGTSPSSSFMYSAPTYAYVGQPPPVFPIVRLRGLPFDCMEVDVVEFFHDLEIIDVLFVHKNGKFTGEAFCVLGYPFQVDFALQRNRQKMGRRYVEISKSKRQEYYNAIANEVSDAHGGLPSRRVPREKCNDERKDSDEHRGILQLRGLPFSAGKAEIMEFFQDFVLPEDSIHITVNAEGRPSGEAFVEFATSEDSKAAMSKDKMTLGNRYIELFPSSPAELEEAVMRGFQNLKSRVRWTFPPGGWFKLNTDGCSKGDPGRAGAGGLIRDDTGEWVCGFSCNLGTSTCLFAELWGIREGLKLAWGKHITRLIVESDSEAALGLLESADISDDLFGSLVRDCRELLNRNWVCKIQHTLREGNVCADFMADIGLTVKGLSLIFENPPVGLGPLLRADVSDVSFRHL